MTDYGTKGNDLTTSPMAEQRGARVFWKLIKLLVFLIFLGGIGLIGYAYLGPVFLPGDFAPVQGEIRVPVDLNLK